MIKKNLNGFSLVEIIMVMAIVAILISGIAVSTNILFKTSGKKCASIINDSLTKLRTESMAKEGRFALKIIRDDTGNYSIEFCKYDITENKWVSYLEPKNLKFKNDITYKALETGQQPDISDAEIMAGIIITKNKPILIEFDKSSGSVISGAGEYKVHSSNGSDYTIKLVKLTGTHYLE